MKWSVPKIWEGATVYILGGGPSLLDNDLSLIQNKRCIGVNSSTFIMEDIGICWFGDLKWWRWNRKRLRDYSGLKITCNEKMATWSRIKVLNRSKIDGIDVNPENIAWNRNSGSSAINLAYHFGAKRIVLLGFDMRRINGKKNFHNEYVEKEGLKDPFSRHMRSMVKIQRDLTALGVELINATKDSAIKCLPYEPLSKLV